MGDQTLYRQKPFAGDHYARHVTAMTREKLHSKAEIAQELAARDAEIDRLRARVVELEEKIKVLELYRDAFFQAQGKNHIASPPPPEDYPTYVGEVTFNNQPIHPPISFKRRGNYLYSHTPISAYIPANSLLTLRIKGDDFFFCKLELDRNILPMDQIHISLNWT